MKAVLCKSLEGPDALEMADLPDAIPGPGEVAIQVTTVALNFFDTLITRGKYQTKPTLPFSPGGEVVGRVIATGAGVEDFAQGQRVLAYVGYGGCREQAIAPAARTVVVPDGIADEAAASIPIAYGTALHGLEDRGRVRAGDAVLVLGATGGAGLAAVEVAAALGAEVIAAGTSDEKLKLCADRGAAHLLNLTGVDVKEAVRAIRGGKGPDVIYDCIGGPYAEPALRGITWGGRYLVIGFAAGEIPKIPLNLVLLKGCDICGVFFGRHVDTDPAAFRVQMAKLLDWCAEGKIRPHIDRVFSLDETKDAIKALDARTIKGKIVVKP
ncbi:NADPH:quinone oxidoreductase [Rhodomicrobium udaipurense JA643]|uniref:NADPH:quinone oxidoreductase family protein n=1 Tax=Rhodomicrobium udaipurense TaxID=1202716 RepID=A0A8I1GIG9_9HYPH|nr:NADPH:quinone oxidoreductase family protein [Rhodomicrobium udaipurense]KAI94055.1 NADPH:quinone oxidoreductase [Rhodomicrobium udaipurense JA643]MBJ7544355.1 NADPH:quinone oxidoreductase family protein [Rhodomicrobium udaipurense]